MPEPVTVTRWKTFDGRDFATEAEADAHEKANFKLALVALSLEEIDDVLDRRPGTEALGYAIERAAYLISTARRKAGELKRRPGAETPPPQPTAVSGEPATETDQQDEAA